MNDTPSYDAVGSMTDDGKYYKFVYDALGRLKTVKNQSNTVVAEYTYNGLNMRIGWRLGSGGDADTDADVDGSDPWYNFAMDDRWRIVATFRGSDTSPKELFAYHNAGANGRGGSSYIDSVILRNKDANTAWTTASDATLEERLYYVQNWRADVSAVLSDAGVVKEWVKYTSYGIPVRIDPGDYNRDGFVNGTDSDDYGDDFDNTRAEADVNFDTVVNGDDYDLFSEWWDAPSAAGRFTLSASSVGNRIGYAGYQHDPTFAGASRAIYHVRNRVYDAGLGRWTRRDPVGYKAGINLYAYLKDEPLVGRDPMGLDKAICTSGCSSDSSGGGGDGAHPSPIEPPQNSISTKECDSCVQAAQDSEHNAMLIAEMAARGCPFHVNPCKTCDKNDHPGSKAWTGSGGEIYFCANRIPSCEYAKTLLSHELFHAYDMCMRKGNEKNTCCACMCRELRAYRWDGGCEDGGVRRSVPGPGGQPIPQSESECLRMYASWSCTREKQGCENHPDQAAACFDQVGNNSSCWPQSTEPPGEVIFGIQN